MPKISVYLPDQLYDAVREHDIPVSAVTQQALEEALRRQVNAEWVERARSREPRIQGRFDTAALIDEVRDEFGA